MSKSTRRGGVRLGPDGKPVQGRKRGGRNKKTAIKEAGAKSALKRAIDRYAITQERVLHGLAQLAFADIRNAVTWRKKLVNVKVGGKIKRVPVTELNLIDAKDIDDDTAAAITEVKQGRGGEVTIKIEKKKGALDTLAAHLGLLVLKHEHAGKDGGAVKLEIKDMTSAELARRFEEIVAGAARKATASSPSNEDEKVNTAQPATAEASPPAKD